MYLARLVSDFLVLQFTEDLTRIKQRGVPVESLSHRILMWCSLVYLRWIRGAAA